jgi:hypothetical protein
MQAPIKHKRFLIAVALCLCGMAALGMDQRQRQRQKNRSRPAPIEPVAHPDRAQPPDPVFVPKPWYQVDDPTKGPNNKFADPPGAAEVRAVLNRVQPVPDDRVRYFAPLDQDPLSDQAPRNGWWMTVEKVERRADGWIAEIDATVKFDASRCAFIPHVHSTWTERYQWQNDQLHYLGGYASGLNAVPRISTGP